jgi:hypothetical protein
VNAILFAVQGKRIFGDLRLIEISHKSHALDSKSINSRITPTFEGLDDDEMVCHIIEELFHHLHHLEALRGVEVLDALGNL